MLVVGYGDTQDEANKNHNENLLRLLKRAREINLKFNKKKLNLRRSEVKFMGHVLTSDGLKPDAHKVKAVAEMPRPTTKQETLSLLGFVNYLTKFLPRLSEVAQPLRELTTKSARFVWSSQHYKSFTEVKKFVSAHPVLKYYDMAAEVTIQCDASKQGLGTTLLQNGEPVAFASRTFTPVKQRYAQIEYLYNSVLLKNRIIIPQALRSEAITRLHSSHLVKIALLLVLFVCVWFKGSSHVQT